MNLKDFPVGSTADYAPMDAGTYNAVCVGIIDLGTQTLDFAGETSRRGQMLILFEFPEETVEVDGATLPRNLSLKCSKSANAKSTLRKNLAAWRGRDFTPEELGDFHFSRVLGQPATVAVAHRAYQGKTCAFISSGGKAMKTNQFKPSRKVYFDLTAPETFPDAERLPKWMIETINKSEEAVSGGIAFKRGEHQADVGDDHTPF
jgi:hypothetical protein